MSVTSYLSSTPTLKDFESTGDTLDDIVTDLELETHLLVNDSNLLDEDPLEIKGTDVRDDGFSLDMGRSSPGLDSLSQSMNPDETNPAQESQDELKVTTTRGRKRRRNCHSSDGAVETNSRNYPQRIRKASVRILDYITDDSTKVLRDQSKRQKKPKRREEPEENGDIQFISESIPLRDSHGITSTSLRPAFEPKSKKQSPKGSPTKRSPSEGLSDISAETEQATKSSGNDFELVIIKKEKDDEDDETLTSLCKELSDDYSTSESMDLLNVKVKSEPETYDMVPSSLVKTEDTFSDTIDDFAMDMDPSTLSDGECETKPSLPLLRVKTDLFNSDSRELVEFKTEEDIEEMDDGSPILSSGLNENRPMKTVPYHYDKNARQPSVYSTVLEHSYAARRKVRINNNIISYCIVCHKVCDSSYVHKPMCTMRVFNCSDCIFQTDNVHAMQQHMITIHDLQVFNVFVSAPALPASASVDSAVKAVSEGIDPFAVSKLFNIHFRFLKAKLREVGVHFVLDDKKEKELANHLYLLKKLGFVFTEYSVRKIAYEFAFENDWEQVHAIKWAGAGWFNKFTERYPCFMDSSPKFANAVAENIYHKGLINNFFDQFVRSSFGHQFHPENIYTVDTSLVFIDDRKRVGVAFAMNGVGDMVPPYIASNFHLLPSNSPVIAEMDQAYGRITSSIFDRFISTLVTHIIGKKTDEEILVLLCGNNYVAQSAHVFNTLKGAGLSVLSIPSSLQKPFSVRLLGQILKNMQVTIDENTSKGFNVEPSQFTEIFWKSCRKPTPTLEEIAHRGYEECGIIPYNKNLALSLLETQGTTNHCYRLIFGGKKSASETLEAIHQPLKKPSKKIGESQKPVRSMLNGLGKNISRTTLATSEVEGTYTERPNKKTKLDESVSHLMNLNRKISPKTADNVVKERIIVRSLPKKRTVVKTRSNASSSRLNKPKKIEQPLPPQSLNESSSGGSSSSHEEEPDNKTDIWKRIDDVIQKNTEIINNTIALEKKIAASHEKVKANDLEKAFKIVRTEVKIDNPTKNVRTYKGKRHNDSVRRNSNELSDPSPIDYNDLSIKVEKNSSEEEGENSVIDSKNINLINMKQPVIALVRVPIPIESVESDNVVSDSDENIEENRKLVDNITADDKNEEKENEIVINECIVKEEMRARESNDENDSLNDISFTSSEAKDDEFDIIESDKIKLEETEVQPVKRGGRGRHRRLRRPGRPKTTCLICQGPYEKSTGDWIKCNSCKKWAHETCADLNDSMYYYCPKCTASKKT